MPEASNSGFGQIPIAVAMLIAACLGSTDAGATVNVLQSVRRAIPKRLSALVQFESSVNDPTAILFLGLVIGLTTVGRGSIGEEVVLSEVQTFLQKIGSGLLLGVIVSYLGRFSLNQLVRDTSQLLILGISIGLIAYGLAELLGGSGFISAYVAGLMLSNHSYSNERITPEVLQQTLLPFNTMTEITVFLIFGLSIHPLTILPCAARGHRRGPRHDAAGQAAERAAAAALLPLQPAGVPAGVLVRPEGRRPPRPELRRWSKPSPGCVASTRQRCPPWCGMPVASSSAWW